MSVQTIPEQGQLVTIRNRHFVVTGISPSLPDAPLPHQQNIQHLIELTSIEDDALGESLRLIWEHEPGARVIEQSGLPAPTAFDPPQQFDDFMNATRWGVISADDTSTLQAPFRSGIELKDYQLDPLVRALQMPRINLLIADDVGLGKTVETGLVAQEMIIRGRVRTVLIVCPAGLQRHWQEQMRDKFGLLFRIIDSDQIKYLRRSRGIDVNPWAHFPRLITSIDFMKRPRPLRLFRELLPAQGEMSHTRPFDMLIVDEAHNIAPSGIGQYAIESQRTQLIRTIAPHFQHKLFLSATPHNGYKESFSALLELLDNQRFARGIEPNREQLGQVMVRRLKSELVDSMGVPLFKERQLEVIPIPYDEAERQIHRYLRQYGRARLENARSDGEKYASEFILKLLKKRLFSSPAAFAKTLRKHQETLAGRGETSAPRPRSNTNTNILRRQLAAANEESYESDDQFDEATDGATTAASSHITPLTSQERHLLKEMQSWAEQAAIQGDSKLTALLSWLGDVVKPNGTWNDERVIIFTEYRDTQIWLFEKLVNAGFERLELIYGGMDDDERERIKAAFQAHPSLSPVRILLATDAASEGIDLQNHCHRLLHIEIPWNPNRMEQRNGRIDRHGQRFHPHIFHFAPAGFDERLQAQVKKPDELEADLEFLMRAALKVNQIREDLGTVGPVIADRVEQAMLGRSVTLETRAQEAQAQAVRSVLKFERQLQADIAKYHQQVAETRTALNIQPMFVKTVVDTALALDHQLPLEPADEQGTYWMPRLTGSWRTAVRGLAHPHTGKTRPITFTHALAEGRDDLVLAHLNHPLVQRSIRLLRAEVWATEGGRALHRVTARQIPNTAVSKPTVIAFARLVITGGDNERLHEEMIIAGGELTPDAPRPFSRLNAQYQLRHLLDQMRDTPASEAHQAKLRDLWPKIEAPLLRSLEVRRDERLKNYEEQLLDRAQQQADAIEEILRQLQRTIEAELAEHDQPQQLEMRFAGWNDQEREQLSRDVNALRTRLAQIPAEIEQEKERIINRVLDPTPRLFPVAVVFLIPT